MLRRSSASASGVSRPKSTLGRPGSKPPGPAGETNTVAESFTPTTPEEVERVVAWAAGEERPLEVAGSGSKQALGRPVEARPRLELGRLSGIKMYEPEELVMTAAAGTPL